STPLLSKDELVGVLSLYSVERNGFNDDHRRVIEAVARQVAHIFKSATDFDRHSRRDALTGLPNLRQLEQLVDVSSIQHFVQGLSFTLLFVDVVDLKHINELHGRSAGDDALVHVVRHATASLRLADI